MELNELNATVETERGTVLIFGASPAEAAARQYREEEARERDLLAANNRYLARARLAEGVLSRSHEAFKAAMDLAFEAGRAAERREVSRG